MFFPKCNKCCYRCGGISPVRATDDMTQPVGQRDGQLYTQPVAAAEGITDIEDTEEIVAEVDEEGNASLYLAQELSNKLSRALVTPASAPAEQKVVTVDTNGAQKMETYRNISPIAKTAEMSQSVGVDASGRLFTQPGGGGAVDSVNGYTGTVVLEAGDIQTSGSETVEQELQDLWDAVGDIPSEYIKTAAVSGTSLVLTKQNGDTVTFTPQGGGSSLHLHHITIDFDNDGDLAGTLNFDIVSSDSAAYTKQTFSGYLINRSVPVLLPSNNDESILMVSLYSTITNTISMRYMYPSENGYDLDSENIYGNIYSFNDSVV